MNQPTEPAVDPKRMEEHLAWYFKLTALAGIAALRHGQEEAVGLGSDCVRTEHILLGLLAEGNGAAARALQSAGFELGPTREAIRKINGQERSLWWRWKLLNLGGVTISLEAQHALKQALEESKERLHTYVEDLDVLLGLTYNSRTVCMQVLSQKVPDIDAFRASLRARSCEGAKDVEQCVRRFGNTLGGFPEETERNQPSIPLTYFLRKVRTMNMFMFLPFLAMTAFVHDAIPLSIAILIVTIVIWNMGIRFNPGAITLEPEEGLPAVSLDFHNVPPKLWRLTAITCAAFCWLILVGSINLLLSQLVPTTTYRPFLDAARFGLLALLGVTIVSPFFRLQFEKPRN